MATVNQPGSRAGIITALVIFVILFLVSAIFAVMKSSELNAAKANLDNNKKMYARIISESELSAAVSDIEKYVGATNDPSSTVTLYAALFKQREDLARRITGQPLLTKEATDSAAKAISAANETLKPAGVAVPGGALTNAIATLAQAIVEREALATDLKGQLTAAAAQRNADAQAAQKRAEELEAAIAAAKKETADKVAELEAYRGDKDAKVGDIEKTMAKAIEDGRRLAEDLTAQLTAAKADIDRVNTENQKLVRRIATFRPRDYADAILRQPDGKIIQIGKGNIVYVDLGFGQKVTQGMTFQIYDKLEGIPRIEGRTEDLPPGKGSLEVVRVGPGSSECRIIAMMPGQSPQEGDIIANVSYDKNAHLKFKVYGEFDLDHNGVATAGDAEIIKRLIVQWGGAATDKIDIDTDFLVMGKEPVLPSVNKADLENDAVKKFEYENKLKELKAYDEIRNKALELQIPVLNENRFLYMIGYWDQGKK